MTDKIRWGILGTGSIANFFAEGLSAVEDAVLLAVGSRSQVNAEAFGSKFGIPHRHGSYTDLANNPEVDVIYVSTPHSRHTENTLMCLEAGKPVICEKPFAISARQSATMIAAARRQNVFLMEAMWTRFIPATVKLRELLAEETIGEVLMLQADFGFRAEFDPRSRLFNPELGGGALLDVGIYPVSFASMIFGGKPATIASQAYLGQSGVDEYFGAVFRYKMGQIALLAGAVRVDTQQEAIIMGSRGRIRVHSPFWKSNSLTLSLENKKDHEIHIPIKGNGYNYEAEEVMRCLRAGKLESEIMPLDESQANMETLDTIRAQWGLTYPAE